MLKVASPDISHKTEVGGVVLHLEDADAEAGRGPGTMAETVHSRAPKARLEGFEVEAEIRGGKEVLIGVQRDPGFGPVVVFGLGGIYVEVLRDVTFRLAPVRPLSARHMIESVKAFPLFKGSGENRPGTSTRWRRRSSGSPSSRWTFPRWRSSTSTR